MLGYVGGNDPKFLQQPPKAKSTPFARYRSTATLISLILDVGYQCPHRTLDEYVKAFTGFRPTDRKKWTDHEPELPRNSNIAISISKLNFEKMSESYVSSDLTILIVPNCLHCQ